MAALITILILVLTLAFSWLVTCGIVFLAALCFGFECTLALATGIWLVLCLVRGIFNVTVKK